MVMAAGGMGDARERLPALWRRIEDAHYSYLETDDSPEKLQQRKKLEGYIMEYLSIVPHECKFGLAETSKVFQRTVTELSQFSAYRAGQGWAAIARYAGNLLAQPWRLEYRLIRLYSGFYKHEVEAHMVGAETLLHAMGYRAAGAGRLALEAPVCPDMATAISRDAIIAQCECQIMAAVWEAVWSGGGRVTWAGVARARAAGAAGAAATAATLLAPRDEIYSNIPVPAPPEHTTRARPDVLYHNSTPHLPDDSPLDDIPTPIVPYMLPPQIIPPQMMYPVPPVAHVHDMTIPQCNPVPMMTPYGPVPYFYPVQAPYMIPTPMYAPIKHANNVPVNGYPPQYRYPAVPTAQLIELESPSIYENGRYDRHREDGDRSHKKRLESSRRNSTSKSGFSDVSLPSLPRSDTQPVLSKAREDGMGTYESWDYVFRNLSSKDQEGDSRSRFSPSLDRDSRTLDRLDREERRAKYQPTTLDLEDGLHALNLDRSYDEEMYRTAKVNENLMRLKQEQEQKRAKQLKKQAEEKKIRKSIEPVGHPNADALITPKVAPDKVRLLTKKDVKDRKEVIKQQNSVNGSVSNAADVKKVKKPVKPVDADKPRSQPYENGHSVSHTSKSNSASSTTPNYDLKAQLIVSLDETDSVRRSPPKQNGESPASRAAGAGAGAGAGAVGAGAAGAPREEKQERCGWQCGTCTFLNKANLQACEMCGKSKLGPSIQPLTSGGRECPACTLVNARAAGACEACGTSLDHCPTYI